MISPFRLCEKKDYELMKMDAKFIDQKVKLG